MKLSGRQQAAIFVGIIAGVPVAMMSTARAYAESSTKGWIYGICSYLIILAVCGYAAIRFDEDSEQ